MKFIRAVLIALSAFGFIFKSGAQINVSEVIQYSKTANSNQNALYLIDFWATWCGPCIHVKKYLGSLQQQYPDDFYIVSISEENPDKVKNFLKKNPTNLAVAIDYDGENFGKHYVRALPHAVLLNANGNVLWEGASADFKSHHIEKFLRIHKNTKRVDEMFAVKQSQLTSNDGANYLPTKDLEIRLLDNTTNTDLDIGTENGYLRLRGSLRNILSYASKVYKGQINIPNELNKPYELYVKKDSKAYSNIAKSLMKKLKLKYSQGQSKGEALVLTISNPTFWDTTQINWGNGSPSFLMGESEIKADNVSLFDVANTLASAVEMPVIIKDYDIETSTKHDWQIHYKFFDLMKNSLKDTYGIDVEKRHSSFTVFNVKKKAP